MNKPSFQHIQTYSPGKPVLIFVSSRRQTRLTALDLIAFLAGEEDPKMWLHMAESEMDRLATTVKDQVWPLTHFFPFRFCKKSLNCLEGKSMTPCRRNTFFFRSSLVSVSDP